MSQTNERLSVSLTAIRAFEAGARLGSFTKAAAELGLTQSAISRHVRSLEDSFGLPLFRRVGRSVQLTTSGEAYFKQVGEAMRLIRSASQDMLRRRGGGNRLTITMLPSVAALWLAPRLADFTARYSEVELEIHATRTLADFSTEDVDLAIRYGSGDWPDVRSKLLATETLRPVCSPAFAAKHNLGRDPSALLEVPLLADDLVDEWRHWFQVAKIDQSPRVSGPRMNDSASLYHAAMAGLGVALGRSLLIERPLAEGRLVAPFEPSVPASYSYWIVTPNRGDLSPAARKFVRWALEQVQGSPGS